MAAKDFQITLTAAAKRLSDVYIGTVQGGVNVGGSAGNPDPRTDIPYRQIELSAETAVGFVGSDSLVTSSKYGVRVEIGATAVEPVVIGPFETGPVKLSDFWAAGNTCVLHILGIPF